MIKCIILLVLTIPALGTYKAQIDEATYVCNGFNAPFSSIKFKTSLLFSESTDDVSITFGKGSYQILDDQLILTFRAQHAGDKYFDIAPDTSNHQLLTVISKNEKGRDLPTFFTIYDAQGEVIQNSHGPLSGSELSLKLQPDRLPEGGYITFRSLGYGEYNFTKLGLLKKPGLLLTVNMDFQQDGIIWKGNTTEIYKIKGLNSESFQLMNPHTGVYYEYFKMEAH